MCLGANPCPLSCADGWDAGRNNFVNGYHDNRMNGGNTFNRGPPRMERGRGGIGGGGYRGNRGGSFNPINPTQPIAFAGYENKGEICLDCIQTHENPNMNKNHQGPF